LLPRHALPGRGLLAQFGGYVANLDFVAEEDVFLQPTVHRLRLVGEHQGRVAPMVDDHVVDDAGQRRRQDRWAALAGLDCGEIVGGHAVQQVEAVAVGQFQPPLLL
jgi:hypothetical protein